MKNFMLSPVFCKYNSVIVLESTPEQTLIGMVCADNNELRLRISKAFSIYSNRFGSDSEILEFVPISQNEFTRLLARLFAGDENKANMDSPDMELKISDTKDEVPRLNEVYSTGESYEESPAVNLLNSLILDAVSVKASDIHLEMLPTGGMTVRFRRGGFLVEHSRIRRELSELLLSRIKLLAGMNTLEKRRAQDGHFSFNMNSYIRKIDIRVSSVPAIHGESVVLRILDVNSVPLKIDELGFTEQDLALIKKSAAMDSSLIIVCGATGSGKSTTLASILLYIRDVGGQSRKIISLEDPVEYVLDGITQVQIDSSVKLGFEDALRLVFRQDPDVLMIGEIRDSFSAQAAVKASLSGHLVLATLHSSSPSEAVIRMLDLGIEPYILCSILSLVISQRLVQTKMEDGVYNRKLKAKTLWMTEELQEAVMKRMNKQELDKDMEMVNEKK